MPNTESHLIEKLLEQSEQTNRLLRELVEQGRAKRIPKKNGKVRANVAEAIANASNDQQLNEMIRKKLLSGRACRSRA